MKEPITVSFTVGGPALDEHTRTGLERLANYGVGVVDLPPEAVKDFAVHGPEWIARSGDGGRIQLGPRPVRNEPVTLTTVDEDGFTTRSLRAVVTAVGTGSKGHSLTVTSSGGLEISFLLDAQDGGGQADVTQNIVGLDATSVLASIEFVESMTAATSVEVLRGAQVLLGVLATPTSGASAPTAPAYERQLVEDLAMIAAYANLPLDVPASLSAHDRREIRRMRLLLDGAVIVEPAFGRLTSTLEGGMSAEEGSLIDGEFAVAVKLKRLTYDVLGHAIPIRDVMAYHPRAIAEDGEALRNALAAGTAAGRPLVVRGVDHEPFWAYVPWRMNRDARVIPVPLGIPGLKEPALPIQTPGPDSR